MCKCQDIETDRKKTGLTFHAAAAIFSVFQLFGILKCFYKLKINYNEVNYLSVRQLVPEIFLKTFIFKFYSFLDFVTFFSVKMGVSKNIRKQWILQRGRPWKIQSLSFTNSTMTKESGTHTKLGKKWYEQVRNLRFAE